MQSNSCSNIVLQSVESHFKTDWDFLEKTTLLLYSLLYKSANRFLHPKQI